MNLSGREPQHVWMVNHHATFPEKDGQEGRHFALARHLKGFGWSASVIAASTTHPSGEQRLQGFRFKKLSVDNGVSCLWVKTNRYGSSTSLRFIGMIIFAIMTLAPGMTRGLQSPDVVIGSTVHPLAAWAGWRLARRHRVPFIYEIRDVWPDALIHLGQLNGSGLLARMLRSLSLKLCSEADLILSPLPGVKTYLNENGFHDKSFLWISNGIESDSFHDETGYEPHHPFTFMYFGSHGNANALDGILEAFERAKVKSPEAEIRLRFIGDGPLKAKVQEYARSLENYQYVSFEDPVPRSQIISRAREADCLVINLHDHPVYQYGISPNKLFDYLFSGRPIITAFNAPNNPVADANAGISVPADNRELIADAMLQMYSSDHGVLRAMGERGLAHVTSSYSYGTLAQRLAQALSELVTSKRRTN